MKPFSLAYQHACAHGVIAAVHLPQEPGPVPEAIMARLHPGEANFASELRGHRLNSFVGGRLALRLATQQLGLQPTAVLPDERGCPTLPPNLRGSISHKRELAVALVSRNHGWSIGIDLEEYGPERPAIAAKVLTAQEYETVQALPTSSQWMSTLLRFSIKEAIYKALDPWVRRYVGFHEAEVEPGTDGDVRVRLNLTEGEGPFQVHANYHWLHGRVVSTVQIEPST